MDAVGDGPPEYRPNHAASPAACGAPATLASGHRRGAARRPETSPRAAAACLPAGGRERALVLDAPPLVASWRPAAAAARALRVAERQPHLEREIRPQEVRKVGAVGRTITIPIWSSRRPRWLNRNCATDRAAPHAAPATTAPHRAARRTASRSRRNTGFPFARFQVLRRGQTLPSVALRPRRLLGAHGDLARDRAALGRRAVARELRLPRPAAGVATSANQKYGGPPYRSRDLAATLPSGAISEGVKRRGAGEDRNGT